MPEEISEERFGVATILHPQFMEMLDEHLASLSAAQTRHRHKVDITLLLSYVTDPRQVDDAKSHLARHSALSARLVVSGDRLTCASARNLVKAHTRTPWVVFLDVDVTVNADYFRALDATLRSLPSARPRARAIAGGLGCRGATRAGEFEYLMDLYAYYGKVEDERLRSPEFDLRACASFDDDVPAALLRHSWAPATYLQGFNHILHTEAFDDLGYDDRFFGAEDREIAGRVITAGYEIVFVPQCMVSHYYGFNLGDIARRKYGHGYYSAMFKDKYAASRLYNSGARMWVPYALSMLYPPKTFRGAQGWLYYVYAFWCFGVGGAVFRVQALLPRLRVFRFDYSDYSFARRSRWGRRRR